MRTTVYLHGSKDTMYETGRNMGLSEKALELFVYACYEVTVELEVDEVTGKATIVSVDGREVRP